MLTKSIDKQLDRAERDLKRSKKRKPKDLLTKSQKQAIKAQKPADAMIYSYLSSDNPLERETARRLLGLS